MQYIHIVYQDYTQRQSTLLAAQPQQPLHTVFHLGVHARHPLGFRQAAGTNRGSAAVHSHGNSEAYLTTSASVTNSWWSFPRSLHAWWIASTIISTASLQFFALASSSAVWMKLPLSRRARAGSTGNALNAAKTVSCPATGAAAFERIRDSGSVLFRGAVSDCLENVADDGEVGGELRSRLFRIE